MKFTIRENSHKGPFYWIVYRKTFGGKVYQEDGKTKTYEWYGSAKDKAQDLGSKWEVRLASWKSYGIHESAVPALTWDQYRTPNDWKANQIMDKLAENPGEYRDWRQFDSQLYRAYNSLGQSTIKEEYQIRRDSLNIFKSDFSELLTLLRDEDREDITDPSPSGSGNGGSGGSGSLADLFTTKNMIIAGVVFLAIVLLIYYFL